MGPHYAEIRQSLGQVQVFFFSPAWLIGSSWLIVTLKWQKKRKIKNDKSDSSWFLLYKFTFLNIYTIHYIIIIHSLSLYNSLYIYISLNRPFLIIWNKYDRNKSSCILYEMVGTSLKLHFLAKKKLHKFVIRKIQTFYNPRYIRNGVILVLIYVTFFI